jgi:hypothetical protein
VTSTLAPWTRRQTVRTAAVIAVGCVLWAVGWYRVSGAPAFESQIAPMNLALFGVVVVVAGQVLWFLGGRRAVDHRRRVLLGDDTAVRVTAPRIAEPDSYVGAERLYHRADCPMAQNRDWVGVSRVEQERAGRTPCGWCAP